MREIRFRAWDKVSRRMRCVNILRFDTDNIVQLWAEESDEIDYENSDIDNKGWYERYDKEVVLMQYTGLKDRSGLKEVFEGDILDKEGVIKGNIYEMDKKETDIIIQDFGGENWCSTYKQAMERGLRHS